MSRLVKMGHFYLVKMLIEAFVLAVKSSLIIKRIIDSKDGRMHYN